MSPVICPPLSSQMKDFTVPYELKGLKLAEPFTHEAKGNLEVDIIIGNDHFGQLITGKVIKSNNEALIATESIFGWLLSGPTTVKCNKDVYNTSPCQRVDVNPVVDEKLDTLLTKFWEIDRLPEDNDQEPMITHRILIKFRNHKVAFTADIEKAFLQIELNHKDRDATRFLWLKDKDKLVNDTNNLQVYRLCRVLFGATPSPFLLSATIQHHLKQKDTWIAKDLMSTMYMDNIVTGTDCKENAFIYYTESRRHLQQAGMNLRQWVSTQKLSTARHKTTTHKPIEQQKCWDSNGILNQIHYLSHSRK